MKHLEKRLDEILLDRKLVSSRSKAQAMIMSGSVLINDFPQKKPGKRFNDNINIRIRGKTNPYVSRGGLKLKSAIDYFKVPIFGRSALDIGASTGGFSDVLLKKGVSTLYAVDVGLNQLDWKIRSDKRVKVFDNINARNLTFSKLNKIFSIIVCDVSFISLKLIIPPLRVFSNTNTDWIFLIKPQFELCKNKVGKGGIVREKSYRDEAVFKITKFILDLNMNVIKTFESPVKGFNGNIETFIWFRN